MVRRRLILFRSGLLLGDVVAAVALFAIVSMARFGDGWSTAWLVAGAPWWAWAFAYGIIWAAAEWLFELDRPRARWTMLGEIVDVIRAAMLVAVSLFSLLFLFHLPDVSRLFLLGLLGSQLVFSIVQRRGLRLFMALLQRRGLGMRHALVLGTGPEALRLADRLERHAALGYHVIGHLGTGAPGMRRPLLGSLETVQETIHGTVIDEVVAALTETEAVYLEPVTALCREEGKTLRIMLAGGVVPVGSGRIESFDGTEFITIETGPDRILGLLAKRVVDVIIGGLVVLALLPLMLVIGLAIYLDDPGPILFRQARVGLHGRTFRIVKFRSMVVDAEAQLAQLAASNEVSGQAFKMSQDPRVTRVGRFLRRTSLDELPQFWNVFLGHMSVVGPRPPLPDEVVGYDLWHRRRLSMKPGITGLWQVSARLEEEFDRWVELDLAYSDRWSLWLDLKIMLRTVPAMLSGR